MRGADEAMTRRAVVATVLENIVACVYGESVLACKRDIRGREAEFSQLGTRIETIVDGRIEVDAKWQLERWYGSVGGKGQLVS